MWNLDVKGIFSNFKMPWPHSKAHKWHLLKIKNKVLYTWAWRMYIKYDNFKRPVEGAMKLLRACFSNFECTITIAKLNYCNYSG